MQWHFLIAVPTVPAKPQKLTAKEGSPVIALSWQAPPARDRNGDIIAYKIRYTSPSKVTQTINVKVEAYESRRAEWNYTILEVQRGVKYTVEVAAATEAGTGDYTVTEVTTTPLPPPGRYLCCVQSCMHQHLMCLVCMWFGVVWCGLWYVYLYVYTYIHTFDVYVHTSSSFPAALRLHTCSNIYNFHKYSIHAYIKGIVACSKYLWTCYILLLFI